MRQDLLDRIDHADCVGAGLALDGEHDGALAIVPARHLVIGDAVDGAPDILDAHRRAVAEGHDLPLELRSILHLPGGVNECRLRRTVERSGGRIGIGICRCGRHLIDANIARGEFGRIDLDSHGELL